jgi:uncharacterized protein YndB with AHSA1/START domain
MELKFQVQAKINKPRSEVFDAVYNPNKLRAYFATGGASGPLKEGATIIWKFAEFPADVPVTVKKVVPEELIVLEWEASEYDEFNPAEGELPPAAGYNTTVEMAFEELSPESTLVRISESGWRETQKGLNSSYGNCQGWMHMVCCLKAWIEHGINLREASI